MLRAYSTTRQFLLLWELIKIGSQTRSTKNKKENGEKKWKSIRGSIHSLVTNFGLFSYRSSILLLYPIHRRDTGTERGLCLKVCAVSRVQTYDGSVRLFNLRILTRFQRSFQVSHYHGHSVTSGQIRHQLATKTQKQ